MSGQKITFVENLSITPARVNRLTGEIFLNARVWNKLPDGFKKFILAHEEGHYVLQTTNEIEADNFAFNQLAGTFENSLKTCVYTLADVLPFTNDSHTLRLLNMYRSALQFQANKYGDIETKNELKRISHEIKKIQDMIFSSFSSLYDFQEYSEDLFNPTVGQWFRNMKVEPGAQPVASVPVMSATKQIIEPALYATNQQEQVKKTVVQEKVSLDEIPDYTTPTVTIDLKTILIAALAIVVFILLIK